jgi:2-keto-4-pentenoate hydratase/2-oxohepta-3-ene-1,7-dioic acid hydratase in catechol pathway
MKIFCVGRNYVDHAKELGNAVPDEPVIFIKPKSALLLPNTPFYYPEFTNELHYECELVLRISKNGKYIQDKYAHNYYDKISVGIDFTARDIQDKLKAKSLPWEKAKAFDCSAAIGKFVDISSLANKNDIQFSLQKNGEQVQKGSSASMIFNFGKIIADISQYFSINIGDVVFTGTPSGVGECLVGDMLEGYLEGDKLLSVEVK